MPDFTIVTTSATEGADAAEVSTLTNDFGDQSEALGYARRMADEMIALSGQLSLDFDYSNVGLYEGDLLDEDLEPSHPALIGVWVLDEDGPAFLTAAEYREEADAN